MPIQGEYVTMNLTKRERAILQLAKQGLSDYKIARKLKTDPPSVTRSRKNAHRKLVNAITDIEWASKIAVRISELGSIQQRISNFNYFL
jgi:DNA-binding CsgD family transcriptional regulator